MAKNKKPMRQTREPDRTPFGARLYQARKNIRGLTQGKLGKMVGMSQSNIAELEKIAHSSGKIPQLAAALKCDPVWLARGVGEPYPSIQKFSEMARELARAFDRIPETTEAERQTKREMYWGFLQVMGALRPANSPPPLPDEGPSPEPPGTR